MSSPLRSTADSAAHRHKPILADRFKTKLCRTFCETGVCPYEERCMFAHGDEDLRSKEMNLEAKLTTEDAIRQFQRARAEAKGCDTDGSSTAAMSPAPTPHSLQKQPLKPECTTTATALALGSPRVSAAAAIGERFVAALRRPPALDAAALSEPVMSSPATAATPAANTVSVVSCGAYTPSSQPETVPCVESPAAPAGFPPVTKPRTAARVYRHDPYAPVTLGWGAPLAEQQPPPRRAMVFSAAAAVASAPTYAARAYAAAAPRCDAAPLPPTMRLSLPRHNVSPACAAAPAPLMSTYGPKTTYCAAPAQHEVLLA